IPFILFTGRGREEVVIQAINSGADFYLQKGGEPGAQFAELTHKIKAAAFRNRAEDSLRKSEEKYRQLIELSNEVILVAQDGMLKLVNHRLIELLGYSEQELLSTPFPVFIHPDDRAMVVERYQKRLKCEEFPSRYSFRLNPKDGNTLWLEISAVVIDWDGRPATLNFLTDITERKLADDSLREEQQFSRLLLDSLPGIFYLYTYPENRMVRWNKQHETLLGYTAEEIKGKLGTDLHLPEHKDAVLKAIDEVMEKGQSSVESTLLAKDGRLIPFFFTGVRFETPGQLYFMGIGIDISELKRVEEALRKNTEELHASYEQLTASEDELRQNVNDLSRTEQALRESEEKFHSLYLHMIEGAALHELTYNEQGIPEDYIIIETNPAFERQLGLSRDAIIGKTSREAYCLNEPPFLEIYARVALTGNPEIFETYFPPLAKHFSISAYSPGKGRFATIFEDITERKLAGEALKESEERFRLTLDAVNDGIWDWDVPTGTAFFSPRWYTMLGYAPDEMPGSYATWRALIHPDDIGPAEQIIQDHTGRRDGGYRVEFRMRTKDGSWKWILTRGQVVEWDADNKPVRMVGTHTDITERKRKEEALRINENRLQMTQEIGHIGCWEYDIKTNQMWGSEEGCHLFGYPRMAGSFPIENFASCITEPELVLKAFNDLINEGEEYDLDFVINPKDGSAQKTLHSIGTLEKDEQGNPVKVKGINQDITERKVAEEALRESEERYRAIYDQSPIAIELYDATGALVHVNPACLNLFGIADIQAIQN
ncbi:MAG: PAS domain S-box protein, partial [Methanomicrobiales archaeon]